VIASRAFASKALRPASAELVPLAERAGLLELLRVAFVVAAIVSTVLVPSLTSATREAMIGVSVAYLAVAAGPQFLTGRGNRALVAAMGGSLLLDGIYLVWLMSVTGGVTSPLFPLVYLDVVAVTLAASYRTGIKLALWHTLLFLLLFESISLHFVTAGGGLTTLAPSALRIVVTTRLTALWLATLVTAAFAAFAERELRSQKVDLQHLSDMDADLERGRTADQIAWSLLGRMRDVFGFVRGVVLVSLESELLLVSSFGEVADDPSHAVDDHVIRQASSTREPVLVRALDATHDPRLSALLPDARNVVVVPLLGIGGSRLGVVALEWSTSAQLKTWIVDLVRQFASHAAMRLQNVWLLDRVETQLTEISGLRDEVLAQNETLEARVAEQTQELRETVAQLREVDEHRQRLLSHLVTAQEEERRRIAGDVHDDPVQRVVALNMRLQLLRRTITDPATRDELDKSLESVATCIRSMRQLLFELRPPVLDERGVGAAIEEYLTGRGIDLASTVEDTVTTRSPSETRIVLYRIAQEALANVWKHAEATSISVRIFEERGGICVEIDDDGIGFGLETLRPTEPGHMGLSSMRERAELAGGTCEIHSLPGEGTSVRTWLPFPTAAAGGSEAASDRIALAG
jgi:signal transduction histidine kinase